MTARTVTLTLDDEMASLVADLARITGMSPAAILLKPWGAVLGDFHEFVRYALNLADKPAKAQEMAPHALTNYGPGTLVDEIKTWDPAYKTAAKRLAERIAP